LHLDRLIPGLVISHLVAGVNPLARIGAPATRDAQQALAARRMQLLTTDR
jgi:hypothetical protein